MSRMKAGGLGTPAAASPPAAHQNSQKDAKRRSGRAVRLTAAVLGAATLALAGASTATAALLAYVSNGDSNTVSQINLETATAGTGINVGKNTSSVAVNPKNGELGDVTSEPNLLIPIEKLETTTPSAGGSITLETGKPEPEDVAITPNGEYAWVADEETNEVSAVDIATKAVTKLTSVCEEPEGVAITPNGKFVYVACKADKKQGKVEVIEKPSEPSKAKVAATLEIGSGNGWEPEKVAITPNGELAVVADGEKNDVTVIENASTEPKVKGEISTAGSGSHEPNNVAALPTNDETVYVTEPEAKTVVPINIVKETVGTAIAVGKEPHGIAITAGGELVVVADEELGSGAVELIELGGTKTKHTITVAGEPDGVAIAP